MGTTTRSPESIFMHRHIPLFLARFDLSYYREGACIEYFLRSLLTAETISTALIICYNPSNKDLHVSRFYPEINPLPNSKYLSAACFYLMIQHCAGLLHLDDTCHVSLETVRQVSDRFYRRLGDFDFHVHRRMIGDVVELTSGIIVTTVDTSMIHAHQCEPGEIPFMK